MEYDRYAKNKILFIIGMVALALCIGLIAFAFYILPATLWGWHYDVPEFVFVWREKLRVGYAVSEEAAVGIFVIMLMIPAVVSGFMSYLISNKIDNEIFNIVKEKRSHTEIIREDISQTARFTLKVLLLAILVVLAVWFAEWLIARPAIQ